MNYQIYGEPMPVVICNLDPEETMISEAGAMSWMSTNMEMKTVGGGAGKMLGRMFSGENLFQNHYTAKNGPGMIAFASSFPGSIRAYEITPEHPIVCQKKAFLASTTGVAFSRLSCFQSCTKSAAMKGSAGVPNVSRVSRTSVMRFV